MPGANGSHSTGVVVELPYYLLPPLAETLNRILAYPWRDDAPVLRNRIGSKWHDRELRRWFGKVKAAAGFGGLDLRSPRPRPRYSRPQAAR